MLRRPCASDAAAAAKLLLLLLLLMMLPMLLLLMMLPMPLLPRPPQLPYDRSLVSLSFFSCSEKNAGHRFYEARSGPLSDGGVWWTSVSDKRKLHPSTRALRRQGALFLHVFRMRVVGTYYNGCMATAAAINWPYSLSDRVNFAHRQ